MAVFHQSNLTDSKQQGSATVVIAIILVILLCCCCLAAFIALVITGTITNATIKGLNNQDTFLPLYITLRTWL